MKKLTFLLLLAFSLNTSLFAGPREAAWKKVDEAIQKGLPKTAIAELEPIIQEATRDKAWGEATKAIARRIVLEGRIQGEKPEEKITRLEAEIAKAPKTIAPLLNSLQAVWYWQYFQQNRWRFMNRSATEQAPGKDFTTWDLPRLFAEIDKRFGTALAASDLLKQTPITSFNDLLEAGTVPDEYRPTLYDFIAQEALKFYTSGEQAATKAQEAYELPAGSPIFDNAEKFMAWHRTFPLKDFPESLTLKAIDLYGQLLAFHLNDKDRAAFGDVDLARLAFGQNTAFGETKADRYKAALKEFIGKWSEHELSALALHHWARLLQQEGNLVEAHQLADRGEKAFPKSIGGKQCHNLIAEIEARSARINTERVWNAPLPTINLHYRNLTKVYFRAVAFDWQTFLQKKHGRPEYLNDTERKTILAKAPALEWSADLPPTPDFKERTEELPAPDKLTPGFYFLIASHNPAFDEKDNQVCYTDFWVSDLALAVRPFNKNIEGFLLQANSGEPVAGGQLLAWYLDRNGNRVAIPEIKTDENGFFRIATDKTRNYLLLARANGQELGSADQYSAYPTPPVDVQQRVIFFTDRALYRPGQTIQFKGIALLLDDDQSDYNLQKRITMTVVFEDSNGKEIAKQKLVTNDYGSFSGSFTAPRDRLMGRMRLRVDEHIQGDAWVNVEEYKRPKFLVSLEAPKTAPKLNEIVSLPGKAESYTGAAIDGAQVKWRVVREVRWPDWWGWYCWWRMPQQESQEIAHGSSRTGTDGRFNIEFPAKPDPKVSDKDEASFTYSISADVTDSTGETRSASRGVNVGFVALRASLSAASWQTDQKPVELTIHTTTLDGEPQTAKGIVRIHRLKEPARVQRASLHENYGRYLVNANEKPRPDLSDPNSWEPGESVAEQEFATDAEGKGTLQFKLAGGLYRARLETQDRFGKKITAQQALQVLNPSEPKLGIKIPQLIAAPKWSVEPGEEFQALWGTGYDSGRAFVEIEHRNKILTHYWTQPGQTQQQIRQAVTESMRGGFTLHITQVRENRAYCDSHHVDVPWSNKELDLKWEHFTSKLQPAQKETWSATIHRRGGDKAAGANAPEQIAAEFTAALYDESLDAYLNHQWPQRFDFFHFDYSSRHVSFANSSKQFQHLKGYWQNGSIYAELRYRQFPHDLVSSFWGYRHLRATKSLAFGGGSGMKDAGIAYDMAVPCAPAAAPMDALSMGGAVAETKAELAKAKAPGNAERDAGVSEPAKPNTAGPDLNKVAARKNLSETAFFFPQLTSDANGVVRMTFTMPEALTQWHFLGFAHDKQLRSGYLEGHTVTAKDLMVQPNPPRFLREGDTIEFTVKVSNQSAARQTGKLRLTFNDAASEQSADKQLKNATPEIAFDIPSKESRSYSWRIQVPDGCGFLTYKAVGATDRLSDGEEGYLPVLSRRILVTESLPLPIRGPATKNFQFTKLLKSGGSDTLKHQSLTVQMVSNPSWYAVMALPYLMEFPHECSEQTFNRLYANALARYIANSDPKIRRVFDQWKGTPALDSPMEKNQDLKSVMLEETPWLQQAQSESQGRKNVGILFDANRLDSETARTLQKLVDQQLQDGAWPWFPGGYANDYITLYITTGFGRLRHLGVEIDMASAVKSLGRLDDWMENHYREILKYPEPEKYVPNSTDALYLYGRSFFLKDQPIAGEHEAMIKFFLRQSRNLWLKTGCRQTKGHLAIALKRFGGNENLAAAQAILKSVKEHAVTSEELGMFWRDTEHSWWWYHAPIETQALMIEAFDEVMSDAATVEECRVWLLKQKQTQDWKTTKATADAVYSLLLRGKDILASNKLVELTLGGINITPSSELPNAKSSLPNAVEAGTGFYEKRFAAGEIKPKMGEITVKKVDDGVAWGSVHWQYLEDMSKVTPYEGTPLKLKKSLFTKVNTNKGPVLEAVKGPVQVGDELVVRIELRTDRDMEYVHLKDQRGSGTEPVNVISQYKFQDGLAYYETTRDTASHFFIDYLPKGTYVFEYSTRVQLRGQYQTGVAEIQCMYAPEFNSHSESLPITVK